MYIKEDDLKLNEWQFSQRKYLPYEIKIRLTEKEDDKVIVCNKQGNIDTGIYSPFTKQWFIGNISALSENVIAWRPLMEPYHSERSDNHDGE